MAKKIKTLVLGRDLASQKPIKCSISQDGSRVVVKSSGKAYYAPIFDNDCVIQVPKRIGGYEKMLIVRNKAKSCFKFRKRPTELSNKIRTVENLKEIIEGATADPPNLESSYLVDEVLGAIQASGEEDYLTPDPQTVDDAASSSMIKNFGRQDQPPISGIQWVQLLLIIFLVLLNLGVIG